MLPRVYKTGSGGGGGGERFWRERCSRATAYCLRLCGKVAEGKGREIKALRSGSHSPHTPQPPCTPFRRPPPQPAVPPSARHALSIAINTPRETTENKTCRRHVTPPHYYTKMPNEDTGENKTYRSFPLYYGNNVRLLCTRQLLLLYYVS